MKKLFKIMANIFEIKEEYYKVFDEIEELDGELTPELEERLKIAEDNLEEKIKAYYAKIATIKGEVETIKDEAKRLASLRTTKENLTDRLKKTILEATLEFGCEGKSGNKKLDFDTLKTYSVNKDIVEVDDDFDNPDYMYVTIKLPGNESTYKELIKRISKVISSDYIGRIKELNPEVQSIINKKRLTDSLTLASVKGARFKNNPYVVIK